MAYKVIAELAKDGMVKKLCDLDDYPSNSGYSMLPWSRPLGLIEAKYVTCDECGGSGTLNAAPPNPPERSMKA